MGQGSTLFGPGPMPGPGPGDAPMSPSPGGLPGVNPALMERLVFDDEGRVLIQARATLSKYFEGFKTDLEGLGMQVVHTIPGSNLVMGYLPTNRIMAMAMVEHFSGATHVPRGGTRAGSIQSAGDSVMKADAFRSSQGVDGSGISVGVISDSADRVGGGLSDSQSTGDLPGSVNVLQDGAAGDSDEGRAMLEHVHDVAPGASLLFHTGEMGGAINAAGIANAIRALADAGSRVITDDLFDPSQPIFSAGRVGQA